MNDSLNDGLNENQKEAISYALETLQELWSDGFGAVSESQHEAAIQSLQNLLGEKEVKSSLIVRQKPMTYNTMIGLMKMHGLESVAYESTTEDIVDIVQKYHGIISND